MAQVDMCVEFEFELRFGISSGFGVGTGTGFGTRFGIRAWVSNLGTRFFAHQASRKAKKRHRSLGKTQISD